MVSLIFTLQIILLVISRMVHIETLCGIRGI